MDYNVALDNVPAQGGPGDGVMARTWMKAAEENGIPTAFVVRDGKIAWIGHPTNMDEPPAKITSGKWDPSELAKTRLVAKVKERKINGVTNKIVMPYRAGDYKATLAALEEATSGDTELADQFAWVKFAALCNSGQVDDGLAVGKKLFERNIEDPIALNNIFWAAIDLELKRDPDPRVAKLALQAVRRADDLTDSKDPAIIDTLAVALYRTGDIAEAVATEEKSIKQLEAASPGQVHPLHKAHSAHLELFRKALADKKPNP
jgi:hypothetical protein